MDEPSEQRARLFWRDYTEHFRDAMDPLERLRASFLDHTVEYGRVALRTVLELNGGGIIALPSLGSLFGSFWSRGEALPKVGVGLFLAGLVAAAIGYACSFFHFMHLQGWVTEQKARKAKFLNEHFNAVSRAEPAPIEDDTPTKDETRYFKRARHLQAFAIGAAVTSLTAFIIGSGITAYILAGHATSLNGR